MDWEAFQEWLKTRKAGGASANTAETAPTQGSGKSGFDLSKMGAAEAVGFMAGGPVGMVAGKVLGEGTKAVGAAMNAVDENDAERIAEDRANQKEFSDRMDLKEMVNYKKSMDSQGIKRAGLDYMSGEADKAMNNSRKKSYKNVLAAALGY